MKINKRLLKVVLIVMMMSLVISGCEDKGNLKLDTEVNETEVNETEVKETEVNETEVNDTEVNETEVNETKVNETEVSDIEVNDTGASENSASEPTSEATELNGYYADAYNLNGKALKDSLNDSITENHVPLSYDQVYSALEDTDQDLEDPSKVVLFYKGISVPAYELRMSDDGDIWNREHIWAKSHGDFGTKKGPGTDLHMIRPTDSSVNARRGHLDFDESDDVFKEAPGTYVDKDSFEPRDEVKGDVARMLFYMAVRYEGEEGEVDLEVSNRTDTFYLTDTGYGEHGKLDTLLQWHIDDPVDDFEINRNNVIYDIQGNRNPFIDHPEYVGRIWGESYAVEELNTNESLEVQESKDIDDIKTVREGADGYVMTTRGVITYIESVTTLYIQDETGGLRVDSYGSDLSMYNYKVGQNLSVTGEVDTYKGEKEIIVDASKDLVIENLSQTIDEKEVYIADLIEGQAQGELIIVKDSQVLSIAKDSFIIEDSYGNQISVYFGHTQNFNSNDLSLNQSYDVVGLASWYNNVQIKLMNILD